MTEVNILIEFYKVIKDLLNDLNNSFNDKVESIINNNEDYQNILNFSCENYDEISYDNEDYKEILNSINNIFNHTKKYIPKKFFDILYQNEEIFSVKESTEFIPGIYFSELYYDITSIQTKETFWKYLQLLVFSIITSIDDKDSFGNSAHLFEAINSEEFKKKLEETIGQMGNIFNINKDNTDNTDNTNNTDNTDNTDNKGFNDISFGEFNDMFKNFSKDSSNNFFNNLPDTETIHDHINSLINGKIGSLAKELAEETAKDLDIDENNISNVNDVFKQLFKNPQKLMGLVNNISSKLDTKMKDGSIKESELLEEAGSIFKNMKDMPGMGNFEDLFKSMNMDQFMPKGGKFNSNAFQHMMDQNVKMSKMKERMRKKAESNKTNYSENYSQDKSKNANTKDTNTKDEPNNLDDLNKNLSSLMEQMQNLQSNNSNNIGNSFINDILKKQNINNNNKNDNNNDNDKTNISTKQRKTNNKKKVNKKK
jgi:hypothetical protein